MHCSVNFPFGFSEKHAPHLGKDRSSLDTALERGVGDAEMLDAVNENLPAILDSFEPTLVLYDAGADAHAVDGLGHLELSDAGMLARDAAVLRECAARSRSLWPRSSAAATIGIGAVSAKRHATIFHAARAVWRQFPQGAVVCLAKRCVVPPVAAEARRVDGVGLDANGMRPGCE